jgi:flagellin
MEDIMGFRIRNNAMATNALRHLNKNDSSMNRSLGRLSSGHRINSASDDAAGLSSAMRMRAEVASLSTASRNAAEGVSALQVAEGGMSEIGQILDRMKELATQAASGNASADRDKINAEATQLEQEITRIVNFTQYGGQTLLGGSFGGTALSSAGAAVVANGVQNLDVSNAKANGTFVVTVDTTADTLTITEGGVSQSLSYAAAAGLSQNQTLELDFSSHGIKMTVNSLLDDTAATAIAVSDITTGAGGTATYQIGNENNGNNQLTATLGDLSLATLAGGSTADVDLSTQAGAQAALATVDSAISTLASARGTVGSLLNRFGYAQSNLASSIENKAAAESTIRDVDMAAEMSQFTKYQILVQAGTAMLAQANQAPQAVLSLLR